LDASWTEIWKKEAKFGQMRVHFDGFLVLVNQISILCPSFSNFYPFCPVVFIIDYGAVNDTNKSSTIGFQAAIDACNQNGGGQVIVPAGNYKISTIQLKSNVILELQVGSIIWGDPNINSYSEAATKIFGRSSYKNCLIAAYNASNIGIEGYGTIDGQGSSTSFFSKTIDNSAIRPKIIGFVNCTNIVVKNISLKNAAYWVQHYDNCNGLVIDRINVNSYANENNDGIDIDAQNVTVSNCTINSGDDAICLKSYNTLPCMNVKISNCIVSSNANAIKFGTGSYSGFKDISIHDCTIVPPLISPFLNWSGKTDITNPLTNISGLALEIVDGGVMDGINIDKINMSGVMNPISIWLGDRSRKNPDKKGNPGTMQNITISNVTAVNVTTRMTSSITGNNYFNSNLNQQVYQEIKNVTLKNISFISPGKSTSLDTTLQTLETQNFYPDIYNISPLKPGSTTVRYNTMPAYGLFIRHAKGITIQNATFSYLNNDIRPVFYLKNVQNLNATDIKYQQPTGNGLLIKAKDTINVRVTFDK
jgi:polygalacturonase